VSSIAAENEITVLKPRTSGRQRHTANAAAETIEEHFRINILYPFTDHVISHLNTRFPEEVKPMLDVARICIVFKSLDVAIYQEPFHWASEAMSKCMREVHLVLTKCRQTMLFLVENILLLVIQHIKF
jgi:hypothetical protein